MTRAEKSRLAFVNPISPGLHVIPHLCPICGKRQWDGIRAYDDEAPYGGSDDGIEDVKIDAEWTVCHASCLHWFGDAAIEWLLDLGGDNYTENDEAYNEMLIGEFDMLRKAIKEAVFKGGIQHLISILRPNYFLIRGWFRQ